MTSVPSASPTFAPLDASRGIGLISELQDNLPRWAIDAFAAATHLGDAAVLLALATLVYLASDRQEGAFVLGILLAGFALLIATKAWYGLPRPPSPLRVVVETGYGFPSGHALGATIGWGALALVLDRFWTAGRRRTIAAVVVGAVALSRVVIGVHYLVDVVAGIALGVIVLGLGARWGRGQPMRLFAAGGGLAVIAVWLTGGTVESVALAGAEVGVITAWQLIELPDRPFGRQGRIASAGSGLLLGGAGAVIAPTAAIAFGAGAVAAAGVILLPSAPPLLFDGRS